MPKSACEIPAAADLSDVHPRRQNYWAHELDICDDGRIMSGTDEVEYLATPRESVEVFFAELERFLALHDNFLGEEFCLP